MIDNPLGALIELFELPLSVEYDTHGPGDPDLISRNDVVLVNRTMGARSSYSNWTRLFKRGSLPALRAIGSEVDVFLTSDREWAARHVLDNLASLLGESSARALGSRSPQRFFT